MALERAQAFQRKQTNIKANREQDPQKALQQQQQQQQRHHNTEQLPCSSTNEPKLLSKAHKVLILLVTLLVLSTLKFCSSHVKLSAMRVFVQAVPCVYNVLSPSLSLSLSANHPGEFIL